MVKRFLAPLALVGLSLCLAYAEQTKPAPTKADPAAVAKLVAQLGSDCYEDREAAFKALDALGPTALEGLRTALTGRDEETRRRAVELVQLIERRQESAQLTQPKMVHLVYTDTPVTQAVQDLARKTGFQIQIEGDQTKLANRKITLDTGEIPFWQAVDQFCQKAGLVERGSSVVPENTSPDVNGRRMGMAMRFKMQEGYYGGPRPEVPLVFLDGKPLAVPTYCTGAVRVRVLPRTTPTANAPQNGAPVNDNEGGRLLTIEVSPEPKMGWQNVLSVRIERVLDEQGNELKAPLPYLCEPSNYGDLEQVWALGGIRDVSYDGAGQNSNRYTQVPIRLRASKDVKRLKEVHGLVAAEVLTPMQPLITVEDILNASNKTVPGKDGGSLKVSEVKRDDKGQVTLQVVVEKPTAPQAEVMAARMAMMWGGGMPVQAQPNDVNAVGKTLSLVDEKGQAFKLVAVENKVLDSETGGNAEYRLTFRPPAGAPKPERLVYKGQRQTTIDVPFVLKDVPLP
jgi:hypothetical protein